MALEVSVSERGGIRGVLFDKDGTLFDFDRTWSAWVRCVLRRLSPADAGLRARLGAAGGFDVESDSFEPNSLLVNGSPEEMNAVWAGMHPHLGVGGVDAVCRGCLDGLEPVEFCDLAPVLDRLKGMNILLGVATNDYEFSARTQLSSAGILDAFDFVCGYDSGFGAKPDPGMIHAFLERAGLPASGIAMVGDSTHDLLAGRGAGVGLSIGVLTGPASASDLAPFADVLLADVSQVPDAVSGEVGRAPRSLVAG